MSRDKADLIRRDLYAALAAAEQAVLLIAATRRDQPGPSSIRVEAQDEEGWDDIVVVEEPRGKAECQTNWQVKRQQTKLKRSRMAKLLSDMHKLGLREFVWVA
jgi:hypothetical protein